VAVGCVIVLKSPLGGGEAMDRDEALELLRGRTEGINEWNRLRESGEPIPNLSEAELSGANLRLANLSEAELSEADLQLAKLSEAKLSGADLRLAKLSGANLRLANLSAANLSDAELSEAELNRADLRLANLSGANLIMANLSEATCADTIFGNIDLSEVKGLDSVLHHGPSTVGVDTLFRSKGKIPEAFLRDCGVPDELIGYLPYVFHAMEPIQFYSCFISYSDDDEEFTKRLHSRMVQEKMRVWYAPEDMLWGRKLHEEIDTAIRVYDKLLLVLSSESMNSEWVKTEIHKARKAEIREKKRKLFPIRLIDFEAIREWECFDADSGKDLAREIREYIIPDFSNWKDHDAFEEAFTKLLKSLKSEESTGAKAQGATPPETPS
jgi:hypothetical protein